MTTLTFNSPFDLTESEQLDAFGRTLRDMLRDTERTAPMFQADEALSYAEVNLRSGSHGAEAVVRAVDRAAFFMAWDHYLFDTDAFELKMRDLSAENAFILARLANLRDYAGQPQFHAETAAEAISKTRRLVLSYEKAMFASGSYFDADYGFENYYREHYLAH